MHTEILSSSQLAVLEGLRPIRAIHEFYLAGGTALALRHGHRQSIDSDFFRGDIVDIGDLALTLERAFDDVERLPAGAESLYVRLHQVTTSFFRYPYPLLAPVQTTPWGFGLASDSDIAAMKIEAIAGRASRKDFVDLRVLCGTGLTLETVFVLFERKYGTHRTERYHCLRALAYFDDAEREPMPAMLVPFDWNERDGSSRGRRHDCSPSLLRTTVELRRQTSAEALCWMTGRSGERARGSTPAPVIG